MTVVSTWNGSHSKVKNAMNPKSSFSSAFPGHALQIIRLVCSAKSSCLLKGCYQSPGLFMESHCTQSVSLPRTLFKSHRKQVCLPRTLFKSHRKVRSVFLGLCLKATENRSVFLGLCLKATENRSVFLGLCLKATENRSVFLGLCLKATENRSVFLGLCLKATRNSQVCLPRTVFKSHRKRSDLSS